MRMKLSSSKSFYPFARFKDEGAQNIEVVIILNGKMAVHEVHSLQRRATSRVVQSEFNDIIEDNVGVVITSLCTVLEFTGLMEYPRNSWRGKCFEKRQFQCTRIIPRKIIE